MSPATPWPFDGTRPHPRPVAGSLDISPAWARHGRWLRRPNGERIEVHPIGALAKALGKSSFTIRRWEREGVLPPTPLVLAVAGGPPRRLYTTQQIAAIAQLAEEEGVAHRKPVELALTDFTPRVLQMYADLFSDHFSADAHAAGAATATVTRRSLPSQPRHARPARGKCCADGACTLTQPMAPDVSTDCEGTRSALRRHGEEREE